MNQPLFDPNSEDPAFQLDDELALSDLPDRWDFLDDEDPPTPEPGDFWVEDQ